MKLTRVSDISGETNTMDLPITMEQLERWEKGELVQNVFHDLSDNEREFIKTGITAKEWETMFSNKED